MTRKELLDTIIKNCSLGEGANLLSAVDVYTSAIIAQNKCSTTLEVLAQLLKDEYKLAEDKSLTFAKAGQHYANTSSIEDVIKLIKERPPML